MKLEDPLEISQYNGEFLRLRAGRPSRAKILKEC